MTNVCSACRLIWYPPAPLCPGCWGTQIEWVPLSGRGTVNSWVVFHQAYLKGYDDEVPFNVAEVTPEDFAVVTAVECKPNVQEDEWLAAMMAKADMIEDWITAVRAEVERRLLAGAAVRGYKLVQGRQGNRAWANVEEAEAQLKAMRLKVEQMYDLSLISPTSAEKLATAPDPAIGPRQWKKLQAIITRSPGKLHVAPVSDKRPAVSVAPVSDSFDAAPNPEDFV